MRTLCDACESAAAAVFCAADEAALCRSCDDKVHMCNKLASRHIRVGLATPSDVPRCDICENAPAFFYCEIDGTSLCLQCDMIVHVGGKRTHARYLLLRQRVEFPGDKQEESVVVPSSNNNNNKMDLVDEKQQQQQQQQHDDDGHVKAVDDSEMIDLNIKPHRMMHHHSSSSFNQNFLHGGSNNNTRTKPTAAGHGEAIGREEDQY